MSAQYFVWLAIASLIVGATLIFQRRSRVQRAFENGALSVQHASGGTDPRGTALQAAAVSSHRPHAIVLGDDPSRPGVRIAPLSDSERYRAARALSADSGLSGKLSAGLQAVPALLVEEGHRGKRLMEVVINGELVRAKDGVGLRAWAVGADKKIAEHAKLFETNNLQNVVNAAAVWQIASVVVAQKHLADISAKLDDIRKGVKEVTQFLEEGRRSQVTSIYDYLERAVAVISRGELSNEIRIELESCERELVQVQHHLQHELERRCAEAIEQKEFLGAGTSDLAQKAVTKYEKLVGLTKDLRLTMKTRALAWYVLSLYPGEAAKQVSKERLLAAIREVEGHIQSIEASVERDCEGFSSKWNSETTLNIRKTNVREAAEVLTFDLKEAAAQTAADVASSQALLLTHDEPTYLVFEVEDGRIGEIRVAEPLPLAA